MFRGVNNSGLMTNSVWFHSAMGAVLLLSASGCGESPQPGVASPLVIGTDATYPPFEFVDENGEISGVSAELGKEIGRALGRPVEFRNINFEGLITALRTGSLDLIISSMTANEERRQSIDFSDPYVKTGLSILAGKDSPVKTARDLDLDGLRVAVRLGTTGEMWVKDHLPNAVVVRLDTDAACVLEVVNGTVDGWIYDQISIMNYHAQHKSQTIAILEPLREEVWAIGLRKGRDELKTKVNAALADFRSSGGFGRLAEKYLEKERGLMEGMNIPFVFDIDREESLR